jgi:hypothetical protein
VASVEQLTCAVLGKKGTEKENSLLKYLRSLTTVTSRNILIAAARRCQKIAQDILYNVLGQHKLDNAFFQISFGDSLGGIFGSTPTYIMHALEEGIIEYITDTFLTPMTDTMAAMLDAYVEKILGPTSSRCHN